MAAHASALLTEAGRDPQSISPAEITHFCRNARYLRCWGGPGAWAWTLGCWDVCGLLCDHLGVWPACAGCCVWPGVCVAWWMSGLWQICQRLLGVWPAPTSRTGWLGPGRQGDRGRPCHQAWQGVCLGPACATVSSAAAAALQTLHPWLPRPSRLVRTRPLAEPDGAPSSSSSSSSRADALRSALAAEDTTSNAGLMVLLRAADRFHGTYQRYPGVYDRWAG